MYRLQNGEMPPALKPKVWWLLIGTNDLGSDSCNANAITVGNIRIVEEIRQHQPNATIVINSLLPRSNEELAHNANPYWNVLRQVNHRLECYANHTPGVEFFNATTIFVSQDPAEKGDYYINKTLMDAHYLHPSGEGSLLWGQAIVKRVQSLIAALPPGKN